MPNTRRVVDQTTFRSRLPAASLPSPAGAERARPNDDAETGNRADAIINAAYELLNECGLEGLTVRAVLAATGFNRRSFYEHFADKDELILTLFARSIELAVADCGGRLAAMPDPVERLHFIVDYLAVSNVPNHEEFGRNIRRSSALCREHMRLADSRPADLQRALRPLIRLMSDQLAEGMMSGQVRAGSPDELANLVYNLVSSTVHATVLAHEVGDPDTVEQKRLAEQIWAFVRGGIAS